MNRPCSICSQLLQSFTRFEFQEGGKEIKTERQALGHLVASICSRSSANLVEPTLSERLPDGREAANAS